jgi:hypothetical protein
MALLEDIARFGIGSGYKKYVLALEPVLRAMSERGLPVSPARYAVVKVELEQLHRDAEEAMQALIPIEVRPFTPKAGYKKPPKNVETAPGYVKKWFPLGDLNTREERWVKLGPWKPSHAGLIRYMTYMKHPVPRDWKTGAPTTDEDALERLARDTKDWLYTSVLTYRQIGTVLKNHVKNWEPHPDGRVHPVFYYDTGTGQLASRRPNVQNAPKHGVELKKKLADKFRSMVEAPPDHSLLEFDYKSFHVHTLAFEAQDPVLMRLAGLDIHSFVTAHFLRLPQHDQCYSWDDQTLAEYLARVKQEHKEVRDAKVKHAFLGYDNGMGYRKLFFQYREFFANQSEAKQVMGMFDTLFPRAKQYRERICKQAHEQGYLISRFGCVRWFWEVFKKKGNSWEGHGEDHEAALSFLTQNDAHCILKDTMLRLDAKGWMVRAGACNTIHDSIMFLPHVTLTPAAVEQIAQEMEEPCQILTDPIVAPGGLRVPVSVSVGKRWNEMRDLARAKWSEPISCILETS